MMPILFLSTGIMMAMLLFGTVRTRSVYGSAGPALRRATAIGYGAGLISTVIVLVWLAMWSYIPPVHPAEYWKFLALAAVSFIACFIVLVSGLLSRGSSRLQIVVAGVVMGASSLLIASLSIRFS
jgi:hypothetical protein